MAKDKPDDELEHEPEHAKPDEGQEPAKLERDSQGRHVMKGPDPKK